MKYIEHIKNSLNIIKPGLVVNENESLFESGFLDSFDLVMLLAELEGMIGITIPMDKVTPESFDSVSKINEFLSGLEKVV